jgi:hypothetical protein
MKKLILFVLIPYCLCHTCIAQNIQNSYLIKAGKLYDSELKKILKADRITMLKIIAEIEII